MRCPFSGGSGGNVHPAHFHRRVYSINRRVGKPTPGCARGRPAVPRSPPVRLRPRPRASASPGRPTAAGRRSRGRARFHVRCRDDRRVRHARRALSLQNRRSACSRAASDMPGPVSATVTRTDAGEPGNGDRDAAALRGGFDGVGQQVVEHLLEVARRWPAPTAGTDETGSRTDRRRRRLRPPVSTPRRGPRSRR